MVCQPCVWRESILQHEGAPYTRLKLYLCAWGRTGFDGVVEVVAAGRGAAGLVKSGKKVIAKNDYAYAYAA